MVFTLLRSSNLSLAGVEKSPTKWVSFTSNELVLLDKGQTDDDIVLKCALQDAKRSVFTRLPKASVNEAVK